MDDIIKKWNSSSSNDPLFSKITKQDINDKTLVKDFVSSLEIKEGKIKSKIGIGTSLLNEFTISSLAYNYAIFLHNKNMKNILVTHDGTFYGILFAKAFAATLIDEKINAYFTYGNQKQNDATAIWISQNSKIKFDGVVSFNRFFSENIFVISLFKKNGILLSKDESKEIANLIWNTNYLTIEISNTIVPQLNENLNKKYINSIVSQQNLSNISVFISNTYNFNHEILNDFLISNQIKYEMKKFKKVPKHRNNITKKSLINNFLKSNDVIVNFIDNNNSFEFIIKHKKRKKYLTLNELSIIYIYYQKNILKKSFKNKKIITDVGTNDFIPFYAKKNKINTKKVNSLISELNNNDIENIFISTNGFNYFISQENSFFISDPLLNLKIFLEMVAFFKRQKKSLYDVLIDIYQQENIYHFSTSQEKMEQNVANVFFNRLENSKKIGEANITRIKFLDEFKKKLEITLEGNSTILFEYLESENILITYYSLWYQEDEKDKTIEQKFVDLIVKEKKLNDSISDLKVEFNVKKITWKTVVKYSIFLIIFGLFFWFIFNFIFNADKGTFMQIQNFLKANTIFTYLIPAIVFSGILQITISCWTNKRIMNIVGQKVNMRHLITSHIISICISSITPLIYGGESVGYWYLRRKNVDKAPIAAMFLVQSLLTQINLVLFSIIFVPLGVVTFFPDIFNSIFKSSQGYQSIIILILMIGGFIFDIFAAIMIFLLTFNLKLQRSIVKNLNKFVEWIPFIVNRNATEKGAKIQYEFTNINRAAKRIFTSNAWYFNILIFIELLGYKIIGRLFDLSAVVAVLTNMIKPSYDFAGGYFHIIAGNTLVRCVNSMNFITPGGMGISDWAAREILPPLFIDNDSTSIGNYNSVNVWGTITRIMFSISWVVISGLALLTIFIGESRMDKYKWIKNSLTEEEIKLGNIKTKTSFYRNSIIFWTLCVCLLIATWILIVKFVII